MKKKLKNNNFLIPSFLAGITGLGFGKAVNSNNNPSINISSGNSFSNKKNLLNNENIEFSKNEEIYDIIKNNLKNENEFKVDFGYTDGFHKSKDDDKKNNHIIDNEFAKNEATIPYVIINPANGPSDKADYDYVVQIKKNKDLGIKNLGYVTTNEYTKSIKKVCSEIDKYIHFYGSDNISGIFLDEVSSGTNPLEIDYMAQIYNYIKNKYPDSIIVANPGGTVTDEMSKYSDLWLTSEVSANNYINHWTPRTYNFENNPENASRIVHVVHSATPEQYETLLKLSKERNAGFLMITTDVPNVPYENLPQNFENLILSINNPELENLSNTRNDLTETSILDNSYIKSESIDSKNSTSEQIVKNIQTENFNHNSDQFVSSGKYSIAGNLEISSLDFWKLLDFHYKDSVKNFSKNVFNPHFNFGYNILEEFIINASNKISKSGDFEIDTKLYLKNSNKII